MSINTSEFNPEQLQAIKHVDGPLLILAGQVPEKPGY